MKSRIRKMGLRAAIILLILIFTGPSAFAGTRAFAGEPLNGQGPLWAEGNGIVAHAGGAIDGNVYTNSLDAMERSYGLGIRVFEVDLIFSSDCKLVCRHDWTGSVYGKLLQTYDRRNPIMSLVEFKNSLIMKKYRPMTATDLIYFMKTHPDTYVVTDFKHQNSFVFRSSARAFYQEVKRADPTMISRVVWQIYNKENLEDLNRIFPVNPENVVLCLYMKPFKYTTDEILSWMLEKKVKVLGLSESYYAADRTVAEKLAANGLKTYLFTINSRETYHELKRNYVFGVYSDLLLDPADLVEPIPTEPIPTESVPTVTSTQEVPGSNP